MSVLPPEPHEVNKIAKMHLRLNRAKKLMNFVALTVLRSCKHAFNALDKFFDKA